MSDLSAFNELYKFIQQIGSGKLEPLLLVNKGKVTRMQIKGQQTHLYNRSNKDTNDNTTAVKHISQRINSALQQQDTKELNFSVTFNRGRITRVGWESEFFITIDEG